MGKYVIRDVPTGVKFDLKAGNGEVIATSEVYTTRAACLKGLASVRRNAPNAGVVDLTNENHANVKNPKFEVYHCGDAQYRFRLRAKNGQIIASGEGYTTKAACLSGIESIKKNAGDSEIA